MHSATRVRVHNCGLLHASAHPAVEPLSPTQTPNLDLQTLSECFFSDTHYISDLQIIPNLRYSTHRASLYLYLSMDHNP